VPRKALKKIDFFAREPQFVDHITPTWHALPPSLRGTFYGEKAVLDRIRAQGVESPEPYEKAQEVSGPELPLTFTASFWDMRNSRNWGRLTVLTEHGSGQSFLGVKSQSYIRSKDRAGVVGLLLPGTYQERISQEAHPIIPTYVVGCPKLDPWHKDKTLPKEARGVVAFSTHWDCKVCPETRSSIRHYRTALPLLNKKFKVLGHAHPRIAGVMQALYAKYDIEWVQDFSEVMERAEVYVCDGSSTIYEWASLDRPTVILNAPWYRRDVEHGLLFWEYRDVGVQVDHPRDLPQAIKTALADTEKQKARRREIIADVYGPCDGHAAERAAAALGDILERWS
jgi:hypothetical protein